MRLPVKAVSAGAAAIAMIAGFEGLRTTAYKPVSWEEGWTIGYGHHAPDVLPGQVITKADAVKLLQLDVERIEKNVKSCVKVPVSQEEWDAYMSFAYNAGPANFCKSSMCSLLNAGKRVEACNRLMKWVYASGKKLPGLVRRRTAERDLCLKGASQE